jgi:hypothetical protein
MQVSLKCRKIPVVSETECKEREYRVFEKEKRTLIDSSLSLSPLFVLSSVSLVHNHPMTQ